MQTLLVSAACNSGGTFAYERLPTKNRRCTHCAATRIACLTVARTSRGSEGRTDKSTGCQACVALKQDCKPPEVIDIDDSDSDDDKPITSSAKKRSLSKPATEATTAKKVKLEAKVSHCVQMPMM